MTTILRNNNTKGNDGKGARRRLLQRQRLTAIVSCCATLVLLALFWQPDEATGAAARHLSQSLRHRLHDIKSRVVQQQQQQQTVSNLLLQGGNMDKDDLNRILSGDYTLVDIQVGRNAVVSKDGSYQGIRGHFCLVNWQPHKLDPSTTPMFRDVLAWSPGCDDPVIFDLQQVMEAVSTHDDEEQQDNNQANNNKNNNVHLLELAGMVFHESRCGSTLVANVLQAMYPAEHRVYSESPPPLNAMRAADTLGVQGAATVLKDVVYLMSRSKDPAERRVFFKIQSIGSTYMHVFLEAFPETPFLFVYRDPVQVMVSQFAHGVQGANCYRAQQRKPSHLVRSILQARNIAVAAQDLDPEDLCAAHLAGITESALNALTNGRNPYGSAVNYSELPERLWEDILVRDDASWNLPVSADAVQRMQNVAGVYSKGRGATAHQEFAGDSQAKDAGATEAMREAAQVFLYESYQKLEQLAQAA